MCRLDSPFFDEFRAFARADKLTPPPSEPVLFYGSSSIRLWTTLTQDFSTVPVLNRGFGGSTLADGVREMDRLVYPYRPRAIILYAGDNDLEQGDSPETVLRLFQDFERRVRGRLGDIPLAVISIKPSPSREYHLAEIRRANGLLREHAARQPRTRFLDVFPAMIDAAGRPRPELFGVDDLHLSPAGYRVWSDIVRAYLSELGVLR